MHPALRLMIFIAAYTLICVAAIFFLVRGVGAIAVFAFGSRGVIAAALAQLAHARVSVPFWIPLCGAVVACAFRELSAKHLGGKAPTVMPAVVSVIILLAAFAAAFLGTRVNGVLVNVAIGIIRMLLESGSF